MRSAREARPADGHDSARVAVRRDLYVDDRARPSRADAARGDLVRLVTSQPQGLELNADHEPVLTLRRACCRIPRRRVNACRQRAAVEVAEPVVLDDPTSLGSKRSVTTSFSALASVARRLVELRSDRRQVHWSPFHRLASRCTVRYERPRRSRSRAACLRSSIHTCSRASFRQAARRSGARRRGRRSPARSGGRSRRSGSARLAVDVLEGRRRRRPRGRLRAGRGYRGGGRRRALDQLAGDRGVAAEAVLSRRARVAWRSSPEQGVDQRRLAGAGRAEQGDSSLRGQRERRRRARPPPADADRERLVEAELAAQVAPRSLGIVPAGEVGLGAAPAPGHRARRGQRRDALDPALVRLGAASTISDQVDVGRHLLRRHRRRRRGARSGSGAPARATIAPAASTATQSPVTGAVSRRRPRAGSSRGGSAPGWPTSQRPRCCAITRPALSFRIRKCLELTVEASTLARPGDV